MIRFDPLTGTPSLSITAQRPAGLAPPADQSVPLQPHPGPLLPFHDDLFYLRPSGQDLDRQTVARVGEVLRALRDRLKDYRGHGHPLVYGQRPRRTDGAMEAHAEICILPSAPGPVQRKAALAAQYYERKQHCLYCDHISAEIRARQRVIWQNADCLLMVPESTAGAWELRLLPKIHQNTFASVKDHQLPGVAEGLRQAVRAAKALAGNATYAFYLHDDAKAMLHWHLTFTPSMAWNDLFMQTSGVRIQGETSPEQQAAHLIQALKS